MGYFAGSILKIAVFLTVVFSIITTLPRLSPVIFPAVPESSPTFDCDDSTLYMYRHFQRLGIEATPILGNLDVKGEEYMECDHVWLLVRSGEKSIAYDWGQPRFDRQHYEGYLVSLDFLLHSIADDISKSEASVAPGYR